MLLAVFPDSWQKGGDLKVPDYPMEIEVERVMNVIRGFGWAEVKREVLEDEIHLTIKKKFLQEEERATKVEAT